MAIDRGVVNGYNIPVPNLDLVTGSAGTHWPSAVVSSGLEGVVMVRSANAGDCPVLSSVEASHDECAVVAGARYLGLCRFHTKRHRPETPLYLAAEAGLAPAIVMLLRKGANANVRRSDEQSPIHSASWRCHLPAVEALVKGGATINAKRSNGDTALHLAAKRAADPYPLPSIRPACLMTAKFLIANGVDTNAVDREGRKVEEYLRRAEQRR